MRKRLLLRSRCYYFPTCFHISFRYQWASWHLYNFQTELLGRRKTPNRTYSEPTECALSPHCSEWNNLAPAASAFFSCDGDLPLLSRKPGEAPLIWSLKETTVHHRNVFLESRILHLFEMYLATSLVLAKMAIQIVGLRTRCARFYLVYSTKIARLELKWLLASKQRQSGMFIHANIGWEWSKQPLGGGDRSAVSCQCRV